MLDPVGCLEHNVESFVLHLSQWPGWRVNVETGLFWCESAIPHESFNKVLRCQLPPSQAAARLMRLRDEAFARHAPLGFWLGPRSQPANLRHTLEALGFQPTVQAWGMVRSLEELDNRQPSPQVHVQPVQSFDLWPRWVEVFGQAFRLPGHVRSAYGEQLAVGWGATENLVHVAAVRDGEVVGTGTLFTDERGIAGIYNLAATPSARHQGVGEAVLHWLLREARDRGCRWAVLRSTAAGYGFYLAAGFQPVARYDVFVAQLPASLL